MIKFLFILWAKFHTKYLWEARTEVFQEEFNNRLTYPQTWHCLPFNRNKIMAKFWRFICNHFIGHEWSKTEKGYNGCGKVDLWCRWCNFRTQVSLLEVPSAYYLKKIFDKEENDL